MLITGLFHVAIKTNNLEQTVQFYAQVLGLRRVPRPNFGFPGAWMACPTPTQEPIIHLYGGGPALGASGVAPTGTATIDHLSLWAMGFHEYRERFAKLGISWREFIVPDTDLWQLFVHDPNGVMIELTFNRQGESLPMPDLSPGRSYEAGVSFYEPSEYHSLCPDPVLT